MRICALILVLIIGCKGKTVDNVDQEINNWYNGVNKNRYAGNDSLKYYSELITEKSKDGPASYRAMGLISKGLYSSRTASFNLSKQYYEQALQVLGTNGADSLVAKSITGVGNAEKNLAHYPEAIQQFQKALNLYEKTANHEAMAGVHSNMAQVYQLKEDLPEAKKHLHAALKLLSDNQQSVAWLNTAHTLANVYGMSNEIDSALALDEKGIAISTSMKLDLLKSVFYDNKGNCYMYTERPDSARFYFNKCLEIDSAMGNTKQVADTYLNLGTLAIMNKDAAIAEKYLKRSIELSREAKYREGEKNAWHSLYKLFKKNKSFEKAIEAQENLAAAKDTIVNEKTETKIAELQALYQFEKNEKQISMQASKIEKQSMIVIAIISVAVALLAIGWSYYRRFKAKKAIEMENALQQQKQRATIEILTAEEKERHRIASDLHDGIGQMMTAAWLNLQALDKRLNDHNAEDSLLVNKTMSLVGESCTEIRHVSHNMMPNSLSRKGLINALREFTNQLDAKILAINLHADTQDLKIDQTTELILYRVVQECVNNVVKHSGATELDISITTDAEGIDLLIEDNGKGFDQQKLSSAGIGINNIRSRIQYLNGTVEWDDTGSGTVVAIHIPYHHD